MKMNLLHQKIVPAIVFSKLYSDPMYSDGKVFSRRKYREKNLVEGTFAFIRR